MSASNEATLYFLGTNARTAQDYHGNLYLDEYFWIPKFRARKVASVWLLQNGDKPIFHAIQSDTGPYPFWSGALFNRGRNRADGGHRPVPQQWPRPAVRRRSNTAR